MDKRLKEPFIDGKRLFAKADSLLLGALKAEPLFDGIGELLIAVGKLDLLKIDLKAKARFFLIGKCGHLGKGCL